MKLVVFGLSVSSAWGNGHATLWRGLIRELDRLGHRVVFFERDEPYYAAHRDCPELPHEGLRLYESWSSVHAQAASEAESADAVMVTSYCPDALAATELCLASKAALKTFYDLDSPVTLDRLEQGLPVPYIGPRGLVDFDLVLSFAGGPTLDALQQTLHARHVAALYGSVDPELHKPSAPEARYAADLSYLGTYAKDREAALGSLLLEPARTLSDKRFMVAGPQYPAERAWPPNVRHIAHVAPHDHAAFYGSSSLQLSLSRAPMLRLGHCPSGRLFEAAACCVPVLTDRFAGLARFFEPEREILVADGPDDVIRALGHGAFHLRRIGRAARDRALSEHSVATRARQLLELLSRRGDTTSRNGASVMEA